MLCTCPEQAARAAEEAEVAERVAAAGKEATAAAAAAAEEAEEEAAAYAAYAEALAAEAAEEEAEEEAAAAVAGGRWESNQQEEVVKAESESEAESEAAEAKAMDELRKKLSADTLAKAKKRAEVFGEEYNLGKKEDVDEGVVEGENPDITLEAQFMIAAATAGLDGARSSGADPDRHGASVTDLEEKHQARRCRLTASKSVLKAPMVSALESII